MTKKEAVKKICNPPAASENLTWEQFYLNIETRVLPHVGVNSSSTIKKAEFIYSMVKKLKTIHLNDQKKR